MKGFDASSLPRFSLDRRVTVAVLLATVLVVGVIATLGTPLELLPRGFEDSMLGVQGTWRQAPAQEMLDKVALPLEEELATVPGVENLYTFAATGFTRVRVSFKSGADTDVAYREVRDRVERAKARMPEEVDRVVIQKADDSQIPVFAFGIVADPQILDAYNLIQTQIVLPLQRIDGVAAVDVQGLVEKEVLIELDRAATEAAGLNAFALAQDLAADNFTLASGHVDAGGKKLLLRSVAKYENLEALRARPLPRPRAAGGDASAPAPAIRLGEVASVRYAEPETRFRARANSHPAFFVVVLKESEANALDVSRRIADVVERMQADPRLQLLQTEVFFNQGKTILESLGILLDSGRIGAFFAALVLFFFLRRLRMTLIIALSIPLSLLLALVAMYFTGETLNILSLLGLMISVGLLVDNSVVVAENIFRLHQAGASRREAAIRGAGEISLAIVMATLTTVIVFLPVSLVQGQGQFFLLRLAIPITAALLGSLLVALIFVPLAAYLTLPRRGRRGRHRARLERWGEAMRHLLRRAYEATLGRLSRLYLRFLAIALRRRVDLAVAVTAVAAITWAVPMKNVEFGAVQEDERGGFEIDVALPLSTTLEEATEYFDQIEKILEAKQEAWGLGTYLIIHRNAWGEIQGWFTVPRSSEVTAREATEELMAMMPERGGVKIYTGLEGDDEDDKKDLHVLTLVGENATELERVGDELEETFLDVDGVLGVRRAGDEPAEELALSVDRDRAQRLGVNPAAIAGVVRNSLGGRMLPKFYREGREIPVRVRYAEEDRESLTQLQDFRVPTAAGELVTLASVTEPQRIESAGRIARTNKQLSRSITLELEEGKEKETRRRLEALAARIDLPEGLRFGNPRRGAGAQDEVKSMLFAMTLSVIFIYLLMGFLFESFILPLSIVTTIPLAIVGVYWGHWLAAMDLDALGLVGIVLLIGVVVNNGIVLVDAVNRLREDGRERRRAVLLAAERRFRPILMTALTTISGMVPLLIGGQTSIGLSYRSFGLTLIGGMTVATLLTLLVVPVAYTLFDDLAQRLRSLAARAFAAPDASPTAAPAVERPAGG
ncbi:MAG: efflux RND transporter permease subunit [Acidobacteriota bacterium]